MIIKTLNESCLCRTLDPVRLRSTLEANKLLQGLSSQLLGDSSNFFSATSVFMSSLQLEKITAIINAIEDIVQMDQYKKIVFDRSPPISHANKGPLGVFMGYDFHLTDEGPKLIEINTNAGGALLNLELAKAQRQCCPELKPLYKDFIAPVDLENLFFEMFINEWKRQNRDYKIGLIAIVDDKPTEQYLYPEFRLFQSFFSKFGIRSVIVDPKEIQSLDGKLYFNGEQIDLIYNRLTDFYLEEEPHTSIRVAYEQDAVVLTPSPHHHALYANKLNLVLLSSQVPLDSLSVSQKKKEILLAGIPETKEVSPLNASELWGKRRSLFFKPRSGFGSKAAYRGEKMTLKVWDSILAGQYVAQALIAPSKRSIKKDGIQTDLKLDIRAYVYEGKIQLLASRLYSGQTTNFRTKGGGFAPVIVVPEQEFHNLKCMGLGA